jgi:NitT/TauT family transport system substrate-binding protein
MICRALHRTIAALGTAVLVGAAALPAQAAEKVTVSIISVSVYGPWYIVKEKGLAKDIDLDIKIIEDSTARNAGILSGDIQCILTTMDSTLVTASAGVPIKHIAVPLMSYGLDQMVATEAVKSDADLKGKSIGADYGFLNHMWMLLTLKRAGIDFKDVNHKVMLPQEASAAFISGGLDVDINFVPFSTQGLQRAGSHLLKTSLDDRTWERGLISDSIACSAPWMAEKPAVAKELLRAWFEAVDWWKQNPAEGNAIIAKGLQWSEADVRLTQAGTIMLNLNQNMGAIGLAGGKPLCASLPEGVPKAPAGESGWGKLLGGKPDCEAGYLSDTWSLFGDLYTAAGVIDKAASPAEGIDTSLIEALAKDGIAEKYSSNLWIGRLAP